MAADRSAVPLRAVAHSGIPSCDKLAHTTLPRHRVVRDDSHHVFLGRAERGTLACVRGATARARPCRGR